MSILNRTTGYKFKPGRFILTALVAAGLTWFGILVAASELFTETILHPPCQADATAPQGFEPIILTTHDGYSLRGWWKEPENGGVILLMGGIGANRSAMLQEAVWLGESGFGAVLLENRNCQGGSATLGYRESQDFLTMMDFARQQAQVNWFGAMGFSAGGVAATRAAAVSPDIQALVSEGSFANLVELIAPKESKFLSPEWQLQQMILLVLWRRLEFWPGTISPIDDLTKNNSRPVLLIFGEKEINRSQAEEMLQASGSNGSLWIAASANHGEYSKYDEVSYKTVLLNFFLNAQKNSHTP